MSLKLTGLAAQFIKSHWRAFHKFQREQSDHSTHTLWNTYGPAITHTGNFLRRTYYHPAPPPDPHPTPPHATCQHVLQDGTLCPRKPVPASNPARCPQHVHHIIALCAIAGHITRPSLRIYGYR